MKTEFQSQHTGYRGKNICMEPEITHISLQEVIEDRQLPYKITSTRIWWWTYTGSLFLCLINYILDTPPAALYILIIVFMLVSIGAHLWSWFEFHPAKHRNLGMIGIYPDQLVVKGNKIEFRNIKNLEFKIGDYHGLRHGNSSSEGGPSHSQGVDNYIEFIHDEKTITLQIQMRSKEEILRLHQFLIQLYIHGIDLNERDVFRMPFTDLRYAQIQELKKQRAEKIKEKQRLALEQEL
jgi:hypothetical protein